MEPFNTPRYAAAVYHSVSGGKLAVTMTLPAITDDTINIKERRDEFSRILDAMKEFYHAVSDDAENYALAPYLWATRTPPVSAPEGTASRPVPRPKDLPSVSISSMGNMDKIITSKYGSFEAENPWVTGEELGNGLGLFLGTFERRLCLSAAYNDAWHDEASALGFLKRCEEIVFQGFGIPVVS